MTQKPIYCDCGHGLKDHYSTSEGDRLPQPCAITACPCDDFVEAERDIEAAFANPCLYCGGDDFDVPYEDTEEHRDSSQHQYAVLNS